VLEHGEILIIDTRDCAAAREHMLSGLDADVLMACDAGRSQAVLEQNLPETNGKIAEALSRLAEAKLIVQIDHKFLSLPVWRNRPASERGTEIDVRHPMSATAHPEPLLRIL
jgi:hypothetical protein